MTSSLLSFPVGGNALCLFAVSAPSGAALAEEARQHLSHVPSTSHIALVVPESLRDPAQNALDAPEFKDRVHSVAAKTLITFNHRGEASGDFINASWTDVLQAGLCHLFCTRDGVLRSGPGHHYVKPSGMHSDAFIRTTNLVTRDAEISFLALACLCHIPENVESIVVDTGGIIAIAMSIIDLRVRARAEPKDIAVHSFGSYAGLSDLDLENPETSVVLLSASTSGGLARNILEGPLRLEERQVVTLFHLGTSPHKKELGPVVCDLTKLEAAGGPIQSWKEEDCPLCARGSHPIQIVGDDFIPTNPCVEAVEIRKADAPKPLRQFLADWSGRGVVRVHYAPRPYENEPDSVYFDLSRIYSTLDGNWSHPIEVERLARQLVPASVERIIHLEDDASRSLAQMVVKGLEGRLSGSVELVPSQSVGAATDGATVVVAGCCATGRSLLALSQSLRHGPPEHRALTYLIGLVRMPDRKQWDRLVSDLSFGKRARDFCVATADFVRLPAHRRIPSAWMAETDLFNDPTFRLQLDESTRRECEARIALLEGSLSDEMSGLTDNCFLATREGVQLRLRPGFALAEFEYGTDEEGVRPMSQADVFLAFEGTLHAMRSGQGRLSQSVGLHRVISPLAFQRFNDGVAQAAILRAALPIELDYTRDEALSLSMMDVLRSIGERHGSNGEARREFGLALATGRLRLRRKHFDKVAEAWADNQDGLLAGCLKRARHLL